MKELEGLLAGEAKSRSELAAALKVSPARVQQLLAELGSSVSSLPGPGRQGKLWTLNGDTSGARAAKPTGTRSRAKATAAPTRKPSAPRIPAPK